MTNLEKYNDKFEKELSEKPFCFIALRIRMGEKDAQTICDNMNCIACTKNSVEWLAQEYIEPKKEFTQDEYFKSFKIITDKYDKKIREILGLKGDEQ